jgi:methyl-accepting chemotaxis protein
MLNKLKIWQRLVLFTVVVSAPAVVVLGLQLVQQWENLAILNEDVRGVRNVQDMPLAQTAISISEVKLHRNTVLVSLFVLLVVNFGFVYILARSIYRELGAEPAVLKRLAEQIAVDYPAVTILDSGGVYGSLTGLHETFKELTLRDREQLVMSRRLQNAMETSSTALMVADENFDIVYMNSEVTRILKNAEPEIRKRLPEFNADELIGQNIDLFHKQPTHQRKLLTGLTRPVNAALNFGDALFELTASTIRDVGGVILGFSVEWRNVTLERKAERELQEIVKAAQQGNLSYRLSPEGKQGFYLSLTSGLNDLVATVDGVIADVSKVMITMAQGDTSERMQETYMGQFKSLADATNATMEQLSGIVRQLLNSADTVRASTREIVVGNNQLSTRTEQQSINLETTASSVEQLSSTVRNTADNSRQAEKIASLALESAQHGGDVINRTIASMTEVNRASQQIAEIIGVIDDIAFQTSLLALNASVEAARAGDQGRGFAVVASEVRNLAQRSANSAKEIKVLIEDSVGKVQNGFKLVNESGRTLDNIIANVRQVAEFISEIAAATEEQSAGLYQANHAVTDMDGITQQNAALAQETASAAQSSLESVNQMVQVMAFFTSQSIVSPVGIEAEKTSSILGKQTGDKGLQAQGIQTKKSDTSDSPGLTVDSPDHSDNDWHAF